MNNLEFLKFDFTPSEKHLGIATVRYEKRFIFRFKVVPKDKGGYYIQPASYKIGVGPEGKDIYVTAFQLDSSYESEEMRNFILIEMDRIKPPSLQATGYKTESPPMQYSAPKQEFAQEELPF
jgi:hypothetical protein